MIDWNTLAGQLRRVAAGDLTEWPAIQVALHPELVRLARRAPIGRLRNDGDIAHEIAARVLERLHANEMRAIKRLFEVEGEPVVRAWVLVLVRTAAIDVMRKHAEFVRGTAHQPAGWISLATLATQPGAAAAPSLIEKQREVERFLANALEDATAGTPEELAVRWGIPVLHLRRLQTKGERYLPVLRLVLAGHSYPEVAERLALTRREVELVVSYIEELLRVRRFAS